MRFSGLGEFQRHIHDISEALRQIDGTVGEIQLRSADPDDVTQAIAEMEAAVDARVGRHASNPDVRKIVSAAKQKFAAAIRQRANALAQSATGDFVGEGVQLSTEDEPMPERPANAPKAFLSHSHADKEAIVRPLYRLLREVEGIDPWLDERDMPAGADIVDAIFSKGIGEADGVVVVLTPTSIHSRWVHEEINVSVVRKIKQRVKSIIPIVYGISDDDVPDPLVATNWIRLNDLSEAQVVDCARRIGEALHGVMPTPVAPAPPYAGIPIHRLPSLKPNDVRIFEQACRQYLDRDHYHPAVDGPSMVTFGESVGLPSELVVESLHALEQLHYIGDVAFSFGSGSVPHYFRITAFGLENYLKAYRAEEYKKATDAVISRIVNSNAHDLAMIVSSTGLREPLVHHIFDQIERSGHGRVVWHSGGGSIMPEPTLRRLLDG